MGWTIPAYSKGKVDDAGRRLVDHNYHTFEQYEETLSIVNNWRSSHSFPLNTFSVTLKDKAAKVDSNALIAQRIKRLPTIRQKLKRFSTTRLSQMQDVGGCRAILSNVESVTELVDIYRKGDLKHRLDHIDNYIDQPQKSGYRGVHLIYRYYSDRKQTYNGLKIEVQLRSPPQHAWATAVETVGTFVQQALKSSQGEADWLRFFSLMSGAIAIKENTSPVPESPATWKNLRKELKALSHGLNVSDRLRAFGAALQTLEQPSAQNARYFLLELVPSEQKVTVTGFRTNQLELASERYLELERGMAEDSSAAAVLVSVESLSSLRRAYPNFFLDTDLFIGMLDEFTN